MQTRLKSLKLGGQNSVQTEDHNLTEDSSGLLLYIVEENDEVLSVQRLQLSEVAQLRGNGPIELIRVEDPERQ